MEKWTRVLASTCNQVKEQAESPAEPEITLENYAEFEGVKPPQAYLLTEAEVTNSRRGTLHEEDGYDCALCKNRGYSKRTVYYRDVGYWGNEDVTCICMKKRRIRKNLELSGLKELVEKSRFDNFETTNPWQKAIKTRAEDYIAHCLNQRPYPWFFIGGQSGVGKTHICIAIGNYLIEHGKQLRYMRWREESVKLKGMVNDRPAYEAAINEWKNAEVLYIDDFFKCGNNAGGSQTPTNADINLAFEILSRRAENPNAITIISSESIMQEIQGVDIAVGGRIVERAGAEYSLNIGRDETKNFRIKQLGMVV